MAERQVKFTAVHAKGGGAGADGERLFSLAGGEGSEVRLMGCVCRRRAAERGERKSGSWQEGGAGKSGVDTCIQKITRKEVKWQ